MDIRNIDNKTYGYMLYGSLLEEKNIEVEFKEENPIYIYAKKDRSV